MKSIFFFLFFLSISLLNAQNWEPFKDGETYNFNTRNIHGVRVDSVQSNQNDTIFYFNRIVNDTVDRNFSFATYPIEDITQPNIFGDKVIKRMDSLIFKNQFNNTLYIKPKAPLSAIWNFVSLDTLRIQAKIDSVYADTVNGILDSIKIISFQSFDSLNNPINHALNTKTITYSKSNGFLKTFNFYEDAIGNSINYTYKISYTRIFQSTNFTRGEVFDLAIGDEYHFNYLIYRQNSPNDFNSYNHKVQNRTISSNGDTITLSFLENKKSSRSTIDYSTNPPTLVTTISYSNRNFKRTVLRPNEQLDSILGFEPKITFDSSSNTIAAFTKGYSFYMPFYYSQSTYNKRVIISPDHMNYSYDSTQNSWVMPYSGKNFFNHTLVGIFSFVNTCNNQGGGGCNPSYHTLSYFKKGTETWGRPNIITGLDNNNNIKEHGFSFEVYPNPAKDILTISTNLELNSINYKIFNLSGIQIDSDQLEGDFSINTSALPNGLYILQIETDKLVKNTKLIIRR